MPVYSFGRCPVQRDEKPRVGKPTRDRQKIKAGRRAARRNRRA